MLFQFIYYQIVTKALRNPFVKTEKSNTFLYKNENLLPYFFIINTSPDYLLTIYLWSEYRPPNDDPSGKPHHSMPSLASMAGLRQSKMDDWQAIREA